jgi:hypothetical protein
VSEPAVAGRATVSVVPPAQFERSQLSAFQYAWSFGIFWPDPKHKNAGLSRVLVLEGSRTQYIIEVFDGLFESVGQGCRGCPGQFLAGE